MRRPTFGMAINAGIFKPVGKVTSNLPGMAGICNLACERLMTDPLTPDEGWWGGYQHMVFNVIQTSGYAYIITPGNVARVIVMDVCKRPIKLRNGFYEYLEFGAGVQPKTRTPVCGSKTMQAFERDNVFTQVDFPSTPQILRVIPSDQADVGRQIVFQGTDQNNVPIYQTDTSTQAATLGETVFLKVPLSNSVNHFSGITGILKDPTVGEVTVYTVDPTTGVQSVLAILEPNETTAMYRRYLINGMPCSCLDGTGNPIQIDTQCRLEFSPVVSPSDYLPILSIPALAEEVQAIRYSRLDSQAAPALEAKHHAKAIQLLNGQLDHYLGKIQTAVSCKIFGSQPLRPNPI